jgi:hypothetical protein
VVRPSYTRTDVPGCIDVSTQYRITTCISVVLQADVLAYWRTDVSIPTTLPCLARSTTGILAYRTYAICTQHCPCLARVLTYWHIGTDVSIPPSVTDVFGVITPTLYCQYRYASIRYRLYRQLLIKYRYPANTAPPPGERYARRTDDITDTSIRQYAGMQQPSEEAGQRWLGILTVPPRGRRIDRIDVSTYRYVSASMPVCQPPRQSSVG